MLDLAGVEELFRDSIDLVVVLGSDRKIRSANPAFCRVVKMRRWMWLLATAGLVLDPAGSGVLGDTINWANV